MSCKDDGKEQLGMIRGEEEDIKLTQPRQQTKKFKTLSFPVRSVNTEWVSDFTEVGIPCQDKILLYIYYPEVKYEAISGHKIAT